VDFVAGVPGWNPVPLSAETPPATQTELTSWVSAPNRPIAIALADLEAERDLEAADREHEQRQLVARRRHLQRRLDVEDPRRGPVDGVAVELDRARDPPALDRGLDAGPTDDEAILVERRPRWAELVLRGLADREVVLIEAGEAEAEARARDRGRRLRGGRG